MRACVIVLLLLCAAVTARILPRGQAWVRNNRGKYETRGTAVTKVQTSLKRLGFLEGDYQAGVADKPTARAIRLFQLEADLTIDGIFGPRSWSALKRWPTNKKPAIETPLRTGVISKAPMQSFTTKAFINLWKNSLSSKLSKMGHTERLSHAMNTIGGLWSIREQECPHKLSDRDEYVCKSASELGKALERVLGPPQINLDVKSYTKEVIEEILEELSGIVMIDDAYIDLWARASGYFESGKAAGTDQDKVKCLLDSDPVEECKKKGYKSLKSVKFWYTIDGRAESNDAAFSDNEERSPTRPERDDRDSH